MFVATIRIEFQNVPWMPESLTCSVVCCWSHMHTNVYAVYIACGYYL